MNKYGSDKEAIFHLALFGVFILGLRLWTVYEDDWAFAGLGIIVFCAYKYHKAKD